MIKMKRTIKITITLAGTMLFILSSCKKSMDERVTIPGERASAAFAPGYAFSQPQELPFKGKIVGSFVSTPTSNAAIYHAIANASGNVTHLGVFNKVTSDVIDMALLTIEGTFIMTNPGGEQITGNYSGTFSFGSTPGTFSWVLDATITGGTGRFASASGEFVFLAEGSYVITDDVVTGDYTETFDGTIVY